MNRSLYLNGITQVKAYRVLQSTVAEVVKDNGMGSVSEWFVLSHVYENKKVMSKDLAALLDVEAPLITRLVDNLARAGLVDVGKNPSDKRVKYICPTAKAAALVPQIQSRLQAALDSLLRGVSKSDMVSYGKVLDAIIINGEKI